MAWCGVVSEEFLRFANALPPVVRAACAVGDGKDDGFVPPDHVGDVVGTKARREIDATSGWFANAEAQRRGDDLLDILEDGLLE